MLNLLCLIGKKDIAIHKKVPNFQDSLCLAPSPTPIFSRLPPPPRPAEEPHTHPSHPCQTHSNFGHPTTLAQHIASYLPLSCGTTWKCHPLCHCPHHCHPTTTVHPIMAIPLTTATHRATAIHCATAIHHAIAIHPTSAS